MKKQDIINQLKQFCPSINAEQIISAAVKNSPFRLCNANSVSFEWFIFNRNGAETKCLDIVFDYPKYTWTFSSIINL